MTGPVRTKPWREPSRRSVSDWSRWPTGCSDRARTPRTRCRRPGCGCPPGHGRDRQPRRLADHRGRPDLHRRPALPQGRPEASYDDRLPELVVTADDGGRPRMTRCSPIRSGWRCWWCSTRSARPNGWRSCCTTCSRCRSRRSRDHRQVHRRHQDARQPGPSEGAGHAASDGDRPQQRAVVDAFLAAARSGDFDGLLRVLDPDVTWRAYTARGVVVRLGATEVAARAQRGVGPGDCPPGLVNGEPGFVAWDRTAAAGCDGVHRGRRSDRRDPVRERPGTSRVHGTAGTSRPGVIPGGSARGVRCGASQGGGASSYRAYSGVPTTRRGAVAVVARPPGITGQPLVQRRVDLFELAALGVARTWAPVQVSA